MTKYEIVVILDPLRTDEQQTETLEKIEAVIAKNGGTVEKREVWGKRRLAYAIKKRREGYYALIQFDCPPTGSCLPETDRYCKIGEEFLRHLVTRAVVGKSLGVPPEPRERDERPGEGRYHRGGDRGGDRGDRGGDRHHRTDRGGEPAAAVAAVAVAEPVSAPEA